MRYQILTCSILTCSHTAGTLDVFSRRHSYEGTLERLNGIIRTAADKTMKRKYVRKKNNKGDVEPPWITREIKEGIKQRRRINRERRNEPIPERRQELWNRYLEKKAEVQEMIRTQISEYERRISEELRRNRNKMWESIKKLKGETSRREATMYNEHGQKLNEQERKTEMKQFWESIYCKHANEISEEWNERAKVDYIEKKNEHVERAYKWERPEYPRELDDHIDAIKKEELLVCEFPEEMADHIDTSMRREMPAKNMTAVDITEEKVKKELKKIKSCKAAGPDGLKSELYKAMADNEKCLSALTRCFKEELKKDTKPASWKTSKTVLLEKKAKPTAKDFRPVALTDISYKLYMALLRNEIEEHIKESGMIMEEQAGFTKGARIEDNITILKYLIEDARRTKRELIVTGIDFTKAFDSIKREKIIATLKKFKIDEKIINTVAEIYREDTVQLTLGSETKEEIIASSGIRQGCTLSATLFKLITYNLITELNRRAKGYRTERITVRALFFADDGLLLSDCEEHATQDIKTLQEVASEYGLAINKSKSSILWINKKGDKAEIEQIEVKKEMKYLGVTIEDTRDIFRKYKSMKIQLAERLANNTFSILNRSCNRVMIGKAYWKSVALPAVIYGSGVVQWNKKEQDKLQIIQNKICRRMLNAPRWATNAAVRGEIGMSTMQTRLAQNRIGYISHRMNEGNELIKVAVQELSTKGSWRKEIERYGNETELQPSELTTISRTELKRIIRQWDTNTWKREMEQKKTLGIYRANKKTIKEEVYYNEKKHEIWFRAKSNCLDLRDRAREDSKECKMCGNGSEDLGHFMLHCQRLNKERISRVELQRPINMNEDSILGNFFFDGNNLHEKIDAVYKMWNKRSRTLKEIETRQQN